MSSSARRRTRRFALASCSRSHARIQIARVRRMRHAQASHRGCVASARHGTALDASGVSRPRPLQSQSGISRRNASVQCCWSESRKGRAGSGRAAADLLNWNGQLRITCPNTQQRARAQAEVWAQARGCSVARNEPTLLDRLWDVLDSLDQHLLRIFRRTSAARCKWRTSSRLAIKRAPKRGPPAYECRSACTRHQAQTSTRCASGCAAAGVLASRRLAGHRTATGDTSRMHLIERPSHSVCKRAFSSQTSSFELHATQPLAMIERACCEHTASTHFGMSP